MESQSVAVFIVTDVKRSLNSLSANRLSRNVKVYVIYSVQ